jgi:hypothetical protein
MEVPVMVPRILTENAQVQMIRSGGEKVALKLSEGITVTFQTQPFYLSTSIWARCSSSSVVWSLLFSIWPVQALILSLKPVPCALLNYIPGD